eukprot:gene3263-5706_t
MKCKHCTAYESEFHCKQCQQDFCSNCFDQIHSGLIFQKHEKEGLQLHQISQLEKRIQELTLIVNKLMKVETTFDLIQVCVHGYNSKDVTIIDMSKWLPKDTTDVRINYFLRCGHEGKSRSFKTTIWTNIDGKKYQYQKMGAIYPQNAISFDTSDVVSYKFQRF